eukprot:1157312-Pelagomonas_calceolata.AAC.16
MEKLDQGTLRCQVPRMLSYTAKRIFPVETQHSTRDMPTVLAIIRVTQLNAGRCGLLSADLYKYLT